MAEKRPVGILFVHGIGNAVQGETLLGFSEPLFQWTKNWIDANFPATSKSKPTDDDVSFVRILDVDLQPSDGSPAHSEWLLRVKPEDSEMKESRWLLAESWWTDTFTPSNWSRTIRWAMQVAPSMVLLHFTTLIRKTVRSTPRNPFSYFLSLTLVPVHILSALLLALLVEVLALILIILAILPIKSIQIYVARIQFIISNWVGDIYLRITSPVQRAAMVSRVKRDLQWLIERCEKVVVVAHSQGSAITYEIFQEEKPDSVKRFVTLGTAIRLLRVIETESPWWFYTITFFVNFLLPILALIGLIFGPEWWQTITDFYKPGRGFLSLDSLSVSAAVITMLFVLGFIIVEIGKAFYKRANQSPVESEVTFGSDEGFEWIDLFASHDPASYGGLGSKLPKFIKSQKVYNHANLITDHTTYWGNMDEFVTEVFYTINKLAGMGPTTLTDEVMQQAKLRRKWRVVSLVWLRYVVLICSGLIFWTAITHNHISIIGKGFVNTITAIVGKLPFTIGIQDTITRFGAYDLVSILMGSILLLSIPVLWYLAAGWVWNLWGKIELGKLLRGETQNDNEVDLGGLPFVAFVTLALMLLLATVRYFLFSSIDISVILAYLGAIIAALIVSLLLSVFIFLKHTWHVQWLRAAPMTALFIIVFHRPNEDRPTVIDLPTFLMGVLFPIALVWFHDRFLRSRIDVGASIMHWLGKLMKSILVETEESDKNVEKLGAFAVQSGYYIQSILVLAAGIYALGFSLVPLSKRTEWMDEVGLPCVYPALFAIVLMIYGRVSSKVANHRFLTIVLYLGLIMFALSCLVLIYMTFTA